jgi:putative LysE/RhtB family amino acid efflux pump
MTAAFTTGFGLGFLVAAQVGPVWLLCARSVLRGRISTGLAIGGAAAIVDTAYAALGVAGAASLLHIAGLRIGLGIVGAAFLIYLGTRTMWQGIRARTGMETLDEVADPRRAFLTGLAATAANPSTIISWAAIFTAARTAEVATAGASAAAMLVAIGLGSFSWFAILSLLCGALGARLGERVQRPIDVLSGLALASFGAYLGWSTLRDA